MEQTKTQLSISLKRDVFKNDTMPISIRTNSMNQCRHKLERGISIQIEVKPKRSPVLTTKPNFLNQDSHIYEKISEDECEDNYVESRCVNAMDGPGELAQRENKYSNIFNECEYVNTPDRCPTLPPRNQLERHYSVINDDMEWGQESIDPSKYAELPFLKRLNELKRDIHSQFDFVRSEIEKRENRLMNEIEEIRGKYILKLNIKKSNVNKIIQRMNRTSSIYSTNDFNNFRTTNRLTEPEENHMTFQINTDIIEKLKEIGKISEHNLPQYKNMSSPIRYYGKVGSGASDIEFPMGLAVDQDSNTVYVVDQGTEKLRLPKICSVTPDGKVQVFAKNFNQPHGICVRHGKVYVTDNDREHQIGEVHVYNMKGKLLGKCRREGVIKDVLGISVDSIGDIYVCDGDNDSIQVFDSKFNFKREIPMHENIQPIDVHVTDTEIYILAEETCTKWCLMVFDKEGNYKADILTEEVQAEFGNIQFFTMDIGGNFLIADQTTHCLHVISKFGDLVADIGGNEVSELCMPNGVDINRSNSIVTSWIHEDSALRLF